MNRIFVSLCLLTGMFAFFAIDRAYAAPPDAAAIVPPDAAPLVIVTTPIAGSAAPAAVIVPVIDIPSAFQDEGVVAGLYHKGLLVDAGIVLAFVLLKLAASRFPWLQQDHRAVAVAVALGALGLLVGPASQGATPTLAQTLGALLTAVSLTINPKPAALSAAKAATLALAVLGIGLAGAGLAMTSACGAAQSGAIAVIDCTVADGPKIGALAAEFFGKITGGTETWAQIETDAKAAGKTIGGCALAETVQKVMTAAPTQATPTAGVAGATLESFRKDYAGGATFHTAHGDL